LVTQFSDQCLHLRGMTTGAPPHDTTTPAPWSPAPLALLSLSSHHKLQRCGVLIIWEARATGVRLKHNSYLSIPITTQIPTVTQLVQIFDTNTTHIKSRNTGSIFYARRQLLPFISCASQYNFTHLSRLPDQCHLAVENNFMVRHGFATCG
jgi:hypothetical protein